MISNQPLFLFSGQGAQQVGMGKDLHTQSPLARDCYERACEVLGWDIKSISFEGPEDALTQTKVCQPALYVQGYVIAKLLQERGMKPGAAIGLSLGELTALALADVFDFETGLQIVAKRGELMQAACEASQGAMTSLIGSTPEVVSELCNHYGVQIANLNCPGQIVISGEKTRIEAANQRAKELGVFKRVIVLNVAGAYHSALMEPARIEFEAFLKPIKLRAPLFPIWSNVKAQLHRDPEAIRAGIVTQIVSSVHFEDCLKAALKAGFSHAYECGPGNVLSGLARRTDPALTVLPYSEVLAQAPLS